METKRSRTILVFLHRVGQRKWMPEPELQQNLREQIERSSLSRTVSRETIGKTFHAQHDASLLPHCHSAVCTRPIRVSPRRYQRMK